MNTVKGKCFLICKKPKRGYQPLHFRLTQNSPALKADEVCVRLDIELPEGLFTRPALQASVTVPEGVVPGPVIDSVVVDNIREIVRQQAGADLTITLTEPANAELERWKKATADVCALGEETMQRIADAAAESC